jgi:hypothetical protein
MALLTSWRSQVTLGTTSSSQLQVRVPPKEIDFFQLYVSSTSCTLIVNLEGYISQTAHDPNVLKYTVGCIYTAISG